jgi:recombination protein RecA
LGEKAVIFLKTLSGSDESDSIKTGFEALDAALGGGGIPHGRITELVGAPTSGMTTLAHKIAASAQTTDGAAAYIDLGGKLDPDYALRCGVSLDRLLIIRPKNAEQALEVARDLLKEGKLGVITLDMVVYGSSERIPSLGTALRRFTEPLVKSRCAVLFLFSPASHQGWQALDEFTHTRLLLERQEWLYKRRDVQGYGVQITLVKDKASAGEKRIRVEITFDSVVKGDGT